MDAVENRPSGHVLLLCRDLPHDLDSVAMWSRQGLESGDKVLCTPVDRELVRALAQRGIDVSAAVEKGQFAMFSPEEVQPAGAQGTLLRNALDEGYRRVRVAVQANEASALLGHAPFRQFHHELHELGGVLPVSILCRYDVRRRGAVSIDSIVEIHPHAVDDGRMRTRRRGDLMAVAGEIDLSSAETLTAWLRAALEGVASGEVIIDLSDVTFIDVAGCRSLVQGTEEFRRDAGVVFLAGLRGHTLKVIGLLGIGRLRGVRLP